MKRFFRRLSDLVVTVAIVALLSLIVLRVDMAGRETITGTVRVVDGDTLTMAGESIRLAGIDAPELDQVCEKDGVPWPCGRQARDRLQALAQAQVRCVAHGRDKYGRLLGTCHAGAQAGAVNLNGTMVATGYAVAFGAYEGEEAAARKGRLGLWSGTFDRPSDWRAMQGVGQEAVHGNIAAAGGFWQWLFPSMGTEEPVNAQGEPAPEANGADRIP